MNIQRLVIGTAGTGKLTSPSNLFHFEYTKTVIIGTAGTGKCTLPSNLAFF